MHPKQTNFQKSNGNEQTNESSIRNNITTQNALQFLQPQRSNEINRQMYYSTIEGSSTSNNIGMLQAMGRKVEQTSRPPFEFKGKNYQKNNYQTTKNGQQIQLRGFKAVTEINRPTDDILNKFPTVNLEAKSSQVPLSFQNSKIPQKTMIPSDKVPEQSIEEKRRNEIIKIQQSIQEVNERMNTMKLKNAKNNNPNSNQLGNNYLNSNNNNNTNNFLPYKSKFINQSMIVSSNSNNYSSNQTSLFDMYDKKVQNEKKMQGMNPTLKNNTGFFSPNNLPQPKKIDQKIASYQQKSKYGSSNVNNYNDSLLTNGEMKKNINKQTIIKNQQNYNLEQKNNQYENMNKNDNKNANLNYFQKYSNINKSQFNSNEKQLFTPAATIISQQNTNKIKEKQTISKNIYPQQKDQSSKKNNNQGESMFKKKTNFKYQTQNTPLALKKTVSKKSLAPQPKLPKKSDFKMGKKVGKGQFGEVLLVQHIETGFICGMKIMGKKQIREEKYSNQIARELSIQFYLQHRNIGPLYGYFEDEENVYLLVEFCTGGQLLQMVRKSQRMQQKQVSPIIRQICQGVDYIHKQLIIHRDIKPENILFQQGVVKICDFGWAVYRGLGLRKTASGSPLYYSPQIVMGDQYDEKIDIWDIGMMTYQCLLGKIPFRIYSQNDLNRIVEDEIKFPQYVDTTPEARDFILKIMKKKPSERMQIKQIMKHPFITKYADKKLPKEIMQNLHYVLNQ